MLLGVTLTPGHCSCAAAPCCALGPPTKRCLVTPSWLQTHWLRSMLRFGARPGRRPPSLFPSATPTEGSPRCLCGTPYAALAFGRMLSSRFPPSASLLLPLLLQLRGRAPLGLLRSRSPCDSWKAASALRLRDWCSSITMLGLTPSLLAAVRAVLSVTRLLGRRWPAPPMLPGGASPLGLLACVHPRRLPVSPPLHLRPPPPRSLRAPLRPRPWALAPLLLLRPPSRLAHAPFHRRRAPSERRGGEPSPPCPSRLPTRRLLAATPLVPSVACPESGATFSSTH